MINIKEAYKKYTDDLYKIGVSPSILCISDVIKLLTEDEDELRYNFSIDNIISGPDGELIKINKKKGTVEVYNSIMEDYFSLRVYDLETGMMYSDGELGREVNRYDSMELFGYEQYDCLIDYVENDFSNCHREIVKDKDNINISRLELSNKLSREKIKELNLKEKLLNVVKNNYKRYDAITEDLGEGLGKILSNIENAYNKHSEIKKFESDELSEEIVEVINKKLYLNSLIEESEAYSKISIIPITDIIESYMAYNTPKTKKIAKRLIKFSKKVNAILDPFIYSRIDVKGHLLNSSDIDRMSEKHRRLLLKRRNELDNSNTWSQHE